MTIDQKLEILKRAMEEGANVSFSLYKGADLSKDEAIELGEKIGLTNFVKGEGGWINSGQPLAEISGTIFYKKTNGERKEELLRELAELDKAE